MQKSLPIRRHFYPYFRPRFRFAGDGERSAQQLRSHFHAPHAKVQLACSIHCRCIKTCDHYIRFVFLAGYSVTAFLIYVQG